MDTVHQVEPGEFPQSERWDMDVEVCFYGNLTRLAGARIRTITVAGSSPTVSDLREAIALAIPEMAGHLRHTAVGVDAELLSDDALLREDVQISLLPPVSGG